MTGEPGAAGAAAPALTVRRGRGTTRGVALVLHGGAEHGTEPVRPWHLAYLRMVPFARALAAAYGPHGVDVYLLRNRVRGWNGPAYDPVVDARRALARIRSEHPGVPVTLTGHSMGGRVALTVADDDAVRAVCALAPWTPDGDPVEPVRGRRVLLAHGTADERTSPAASRGYAERAVAVAGHLARVELTGERHAMLRRPGVWRRLVLDTTARGLELPAGPRVADLDDAWCEPAPTHLSITL
ncbi:alpha/beta hydrolase [Prauserella halophila]|nr:alpha/beta fold hydrolase [Prauserella halophila]